MPKKTQLDKAIDQLSGEIAILQAARERLQQQRAKAPVRRPRPVPVAAVKGGV